MNTFLKVMIGVECVLFLVLILPIIWRWKKSKKS